MALTRPFSDTVKARAEHDPAFRVGLVEEAIDALREADLATGKLLIRDYADATRQLAHGDRICEPTTPAQCVREDADD